MLSEVRFEGVHKIFGTETAVEDLNLTVNAGEFLVLVGPSGCGKTTTLRMLAGLERPSYGRILIGDRLVNNVSPRYRDVAMVFQSYALYPHMNVYDNLAFGMRARGAAGTVIAQRVQETADVLGLAQLMKRRRYSFVTLEDALRDEAYGAADTYTGEESIDWLGRWAITKGIKTLGDVLDGIPDVPGFVTEAADDRAGPPARHRR